MIRATAFLVCIAAAGLLTTSTGAAALSHRRPSSGHSPRGGQHVAVFPTGLRTLDGSANNRRHPDWGRAGTPYTRVAPASYADGVGAMVAGPEPRYVSNRIFNDRGQNLFSENGVTQWGFTWGQFLDHTFGLRQTGGADSPLDFR